MTTKLRIGVIGAGDFAETCHVPGINSHPQAQVVALCGRRFGHARAMADRLGVPDVHTDYRELCSRADIDAVTIATPNVEHVEPAKIALRCRKHVFCEKPLSMTVAEAQEMLREAEASGKVHQVGFIYRYLYGVRELQRRLRLGEIGNPHYLRIQYDGWNGLIDWKAGWRRKLSLAGGGMLYDRGSHLFDIARFVFGPLEMITGFFNNIPRQQVGLPAEVETDEIAAAWFRHVKGVRGQLFMSQATPTFAENGYLEVIGTEGALKASLSRGTIDVLKVSSPKHPAWEELPLSEAAKDGKPHCLSMMMRSFVESCLRGKLNSDTDASFHDGLAVQEALAAVHEANDHLKWVRLS
jgi:predicted dehydrogenase